MDMMAIYGEAGMIGICGALLVYLVMSLSKKSESQQESLKELEVENKGQSESINNMEGMIIKLISRWNESDAVRDRRYEQMMEAISDLEKQLSRMDGIMSRMNGNGRH
jgi:predicted RNase H-like nuclease (RuvC/YqgF family)|tara:strand:+ start:1009 stop:1332 length:324 start_codon:yes stop_codon:yes gene_type:complete